MVKSMEKIYTVEEIKKVAVSLARKYQVEAVYLFGSYAKGNATADSDIDILVFGGSGFRLTNIFAFAEELREAYQKDVDAYEIHEVNEGSRFYEEIMEERLLLA